MLSQILRPRKLFVIFVCTVVAVLCVLLSVTLRKQNSSIDIEVCNSIDMGTLLKEQKGIEYKEIVIKNNSSKSLSLKKVQVSCGCVKHEIVTPAIMPGDSGSIKLGIDTTDKECGGFSHSAMLYLDEGNNLFHKKINVHGQVESLLDVKPRALYLSRYDSTQDIVKEVQMINNSDKKLLVSCLNNDQYQLLNSPVEIFPSVPQSVKIIVKKRHVVRNRDYVPAVVEGS
ncbi:MAG TPA: DUF1573 domain-containing protein [Anaerohalosphaeraceae bacterium]|nr:DUF1573 domain-containing protein [Anaerohalosphaeraceae bacterium]